MALKLPRPVLEPPCEHCGEQDEHGEGCPGEARPLPLAEAIARAQSIEDSRLQGRIRGYLALRDEACPGCKRGGKSRYPDWRCSEHTVWRSGSGLERRTADNDRRDYLALWRAFFGAIDHLGI